MLKPSQGHFKQSDERQYVCTKAILLKTNQKSGKLKSTF